MLRDNFMNGQLSLVIPERLLMLAREIHGL